MNQALYAHMNNKRKMKKKIYIYLQKKKEVSFFTSNNKKKKKEISYTFLTLLPTCSRLLASPMRKSRV
jgi:hypothetical protein